MADKAGDMLDIVRDILLTARLDNKERFKQVGCWKRLGDGKGEAHRMIQYLLSLPGSLGCNLTLPPGWLLPAPGPRACLPADGAGDKEQP
jgi:hypothetical protein